jgi:hypothetical protein
MKQTLKEGSMNLTTEEVEGGVGDKGQIFSSEFLDISLKLHFQKYGHLPTLDALLKNEYEKGFRAGVNQERRAHEREANAGNKRPNVPMSGKVEAR